MRFLSAASLWWAVPILGAIIALYLLKMRRQDMRVPATFLWPQITSDVRANAPFQRLRFSILLLMQFLAAALMIFAFAGPLQRAKGLAGAATVVVLDDSASMQVTDVSPTRFGNALLRVRSLIDSMTPSDRMALILAGAQTRIVFPLTGDKAQMDRAVLSILPSDAPSNMAEALRLASALVNGRPSAKIVVLSDGVFPKVTDFSPGRAELTYVPIGTSYKNVAIISFNSALAPTGALQCFSAIHNYDSSPMSVNVSFSVDDNLTDAKQIIVPASQNTYLTFNAPPTGRKADLTIAASGDILPSDDHATIFLKGQGTVRTLLVTNGNLFLANALSLDPAIRLESASDIPDYELASSGGPGRYDLVVFDNVPPRPVKAPAIWSFGIPDPSFGVRETGIIPHPQVIDWSRTDPVMRFVDMSNLNILKASRVSEVAGSGARTIVQGNDGPLIVSSQSNGKRTLYTAWSLLDSDFPLHVAFPIFVANSIAWLTTGQQRSSVEQGGLSALTGQTFSIATPDGSATLIAPDGMRQQLDASNGAAVVRSANRVGMYRVDGPNTHTMIAVNLLNESASDVRTKSYLDLSGTSVAAIQGQAFIFSQVWRPIVCAVLLLLACEWWVFMRRS